MLTALQLKCSVSAILWNSVPSRFVSRRPVMRLRFTFHTAIEGFTAPVSTVKNCYFIEGKLPSREIFLTCDCTRVFLVILVSRICTDAIITWFPLQTIDEVRRSCGFFGKGGKVINEKNVTTLSLLVYRHIKHEKMFSSVIFWGEISSRP